MSKRINLSQMISILVIGILIGITIGHIFGFNKGINQAYVNTITTCNLVCQLESEGYCRLRLGPMDYYGYMEHLKWYEDIRDNKTDFYAKRPDCKFPDEYE